MRTVKIRKLLACAGIALCFMGSNPGSAQDSDSADLARKLSNPVAAMISVPMQFNYDSGYGPADGYKAFINVQPVIPISLNDNWNMISRTIIPIVWQNDIAGNSGSQSGLGDISQSLFFSPKSPGPDGLIWGVGPVFLLPTGTDSLLSGRKWGAGPTGVALKQQGPWTYGILANHIWSFAGSSPRPDINATYLQPFVSYTTPSAWSFTLNTESTYNWTADTWSVPINFMVSKMTKFGKQPVSLQAGVRYWTTSPDSGPDGFGGRLALTFLFPVK